MFTRLTVGLVIGLGLVVFIITLLAHIAAPIVPSDGEIAFAIYEYGNPDIFLLDITRGFLRNLTRHRAYDFAPAWSPDGSQMAFLSDRDAGGSQIYVMRGDGSQLRRISDAAGRYLAPRWSADGQRITFIRVVGTEQVLFSTNTDGSDLQQETDDALSGNQVIDIGIDTATTGGGLRSPAGRHSARMYFANGIWLLTVRDLSSGGVIFEMELGQGYPEPPIWSADGNRLAIIIYGSAFTPNYGRRLVSRLLIFDVEGKLQEAASEAAVYAAAAWRP